MKNEYYSLSVNDEENSADLYIFGDIEDSFSTGLEEYSEVDVGAVSSLSIAKDLQALDVSTINVHINSLGGLTNEGLAIYNLLKCNKAKVKTYCDGFACSAASLIFMAGDERVMGAASALMIHNAWTCAQGNAAQLQQQADVLDKISQIAANAYAEKVSVPREKLDALLDGENHEGTWISPQDALDMGFATSISSELSYSAAHQSAKSQILEKIFAKENTVKVSLDSEGFTKQLEKLEKAVRESKVSPTTENKLTNLQRIKMRGRKNENG